MENQYIERGIYKVRQDGTKEFVAFKTREEKLAQAQFNLASAYAVGVGVPQAFVEAVKWYRKAAKQGHSSAQVYLGGHYQHGIGVPQDQKEADKWYRKAAAQLRYAQRKEQRNRAV
jgi:TPR repeat protein